jgi:hypothetical protein
MAGPSEQKSSSSSSSTSTTPPNDANKDTKQKKDGTGKDGKKSDDKKDDKADTLTLGKAKTPIPHVVVVHPLVLLSVVDHYTRVAKDTSKRVVGVLLGEQVKGQIDITNSFALPFEEDAKDINIWYIDRQYMEDISTHSWGLTHWAILTVAANSILSACEASTFLTHRG